MLSRNILTLRPPIQPHRIHACNLVHTRADVARVEHLRANLARLWKQFTSRRLSSQPREGVGRDRGEGEAGDGGDGAARDGTGAL